MKSPKLHRLTHGSSKWELSSKRNMAVIQNTSQTNSSSKFNCYTHKCYSQWTVAKASKSWRLFQKSTLMLFQVRLLTAAWIWSTRFWSRLISTSPSSTGLWRNFLRHLWCGNASKLCKKRATAKTVEFYSLLRRTSEPVISVLDNPRLPLKLSENASLFRIN